MLFEKSAHSGNFSRISEQIGCFFLVQFFIQILRVFWPQWLISIKNDKNPFLKNKFFHQKINFLAHSEDWNQLTLLSATLGQKFANFGSKMHQKKPIYAQNIFHPNSNFSWCNGVTSSLNLGHFSLLKSKETQKTLIRSKL